MSHTEFSKEFTASERALMAFAWRLTKDHQDASDLFQETAYRAFKSRHSFLPGTNLLAWLTTIMRNTFINNYRKTRRRQMIQDETGDLHYLNSGDQEISNLGEGNILLEELTEIIESQDTLIRVPFQLYLKGYKYDEIAERLDVPLGTIKSRIFLARKKIQQIIKMRYKTSSSAEILYSGYA